MSHPRDMGPHSMLVWPRLTKLWLHLINGNNTNQINTGTPLVWFSYWWENRSGEFCDVYQNHLAPRTLLQSPCSCQSMAKVLCERLSQKVDALFMVTGSGAFSTGMQFPEHEVGWQLIPFPESRGCGACRVDSGGPWPGPCPGACCVLRSALWERAATVPSCHTPGSWGENPILKQ